MAKNKPEPSKRAKKLRAEAVENRDILPQAEIDRLLSSPGEEAENTGMPEESDDGRRQFPYDFRHPSRVSRDQMRTMENLHSNLARMMASGFSSLQRAIVDVDIAFVDQTTYAEFIMSLSNPGISYTFRMEPLGGPAIIDFSPHVAYSFIERYFGSTRQQIAEKRPLSAVERSVMAKPLIRMLEDLEKTWEPLLKVEIHDAELETNAEFMQAASPSDVVILIAFEVNSQHASGLITLAYPYWTLEPIMNLLNIQRPPSSGSEDTAAAVSRRQRSLDLIHEIDTEIVVEWGQGAFPMADITSLVEGDMLVLDTRADDPATIYVEDRPLFLGQPGASNRGQSAVRIIRALSPTEGRRYD